MNPFEKAVLSAIDNKKDITLELGCGNRKRHESAICIDALAYDCVDIVGDIYESLCCFPDQCVSAVYSYHCFEHLTDIQSIMIELARITKEKGRLFVVTPHFSNPYYYSDLTHRTPFGLYTFSYLANDNLFTRKVPNYSRVLDFDLMDVKLIFKSPRPFYFRWGIKKIFQTIFNINRYLMEFYEENVCYLIPCYEVHYELKRRENITS